MNGESPVGQNGKKSNRHVRIQTPCGGKKHKKGKKHKGPGGKKNKAGHKQKAKQ